MNILTDLCLLENRVLHGFILFENAVIFLVRILIAEVLDHLRVHKVHSMAAFERCNAVATAALGNGICDVLLRSENCLIKHFCWNYIIKEIPFVHFKFSAANLKI